MGSIATASTPRILLLDEGWPSTLYVAAGLMRAGIEVVLGSTSVADTVFLRRFVPFVRLPPLTDERFLSTVEEIAVAHGCQRVMGCSDETMSRITGLHARNPSLQIAPSIMPWQRALLADKHALVDHVARHGVRVLARERIRDEMELNAVVERLGLTVVLKVSRGVGGDGVRVARSQEHALDGARELYRRYDEWPVVEHFAAGPTFLVGGLFHAGEPSALYMGVKREVYPEVTGPSIRIESVVNDELRTQALAAFRSLQWTGLASADFVLDADGRFYFLELNPRPWGAIAAAAQAGVDLFKPMAAQLRGVPPQRGASARAGVDTYLFPQYWRVRLMTHGRRHWAKPEVIAALFRSIPWRSPWLALHFLRVLQWELVTPATLGASSISLP